MTTAIIIRPNQYPSPQVLECDGPLGTPEVRRLPLTNVSFFMSFEEWTALPPHHKATEPHPETIDYNSACRIARIIDHCEYTGILPLKHLHEIRWRIEMLFPHCTGDSIRRQDLFA